MSKTKWPHWTVGDSKISAKLPLKRRQNDVQNIRKGFRHRSRFVVSAVDVPCTDICISLHLKGRPPNYTIFRCEAQITIPSFSETISAFHIYQTRNMKTLALSTLWHVPVLLFWNFSGWNLSRPEKVRKVGTIWTPFFCRNVIGEFYSTRMHIWKKNSHCATKFESGKPA